MSIAEAMSKLPSVGWVQEPSPLTALTTLARHLGLAALHVKRDDLLPGLHGGNKLRKLDLLLATAPFKDAPRIASLGAIGSGHLAACVAAATALGKRVDAFMFDEPLSEGVLENLAFVASGPSAITFFGSRLEIAARKPSLVLAPVVDGVPMIPPGGTLPAAVAGFVRAAFELRAQIDAGLLEPPDVVYCALGTAGTAAGLALGLGLAGVRAELRAVSTVERVFATDRALHKVIAGAARWLSEHGVACTAAQALPVRIVRTQLGRGYGVPSAQSIAAVEVLRSEGVASEPVYTGKAFAALLADAARHQGKQRVLFWSTLRRGPLPHDVEWRAKLPPRLSRRLDRATTPRKLGRRLFLLGGAAALGACAMPRFMGYREIGWTGAVLRSWEAEVLAAAANALSGVPEVAGLVVAANVDRYLVPMSETMKGEVHQLLALVEHGTTPLALFGARFTKLNLAAREAWLLSLNGRGGLLAQAYQGLHKLVMLGAYQEPASWQALGYAGPWPPVMAPELVGAPYESLRANKGALPRARVAGAKAAP
ncbi:MAG: pyridoxal-phosphate dependent enzyme [Deltaproteobacteria bacterium]|nr:pyridoxal-phosphate dependent enzyme [Deltaproteobacteria bacterium]